MQNIINKIYNNKSSIKKYYYEFIFYQIFLTPIYNHPIIPQNNVRERKIFIV